MGDALLPTRDAAAKSVVAWHSAVNLKLSLTQDGIRDDVWRPVRSCPFEVLGSHIGDVADSRARTERG